MDTNNFVNIHSHKISNDAAISIVNIILDKNDGNFTDPSLLENDKPNIHFSVGIHPWFLNNWQSRVSALENIGNHSKVIAIGECGLDKTQDTSLSEQTEVFRVHINLSEKLKKPLIIHCVKAYNELIQIKKKVNPKQPWIIHGFNNNAQIARQCVESGMCISLGKSLFNTQLNSMLVTCIPLSHLFLETDETDFTIQEIYQKYADLKEIPMDRLKFDMTRNFNNYFKTGQSPQ